MTETKEQLEKGVFERFLATQDALRTKSWTYIGAHHGRPDFVSADGVGVELAEWLHEGQTRTSREIDRFEEKIVSTAERRGLTAFLKSFEASEERRYQVALHLREVPRRRCWPKLTNELLEFLLVCPKPSSGREIEHGMVFGASLSRELGRYFATVHVLRVRNEISLGIGISRGGSFDPKDAVDALREVLHDKIERKRELYRKTREEKSLLALDLVVHYGRGLIWNSPYHGIGLRQGKAVDEMTSRGIVTDQARLCVAGLGPSAFDQVFLFFDFGSGSDCRKIWP
jgi:hypothetical protein